MSMFQQQENLKAIFVLCSLCLLLGICSAIAATTPPDGIQRADLRVTSDEFTQQTRSIVLSGEELILAKGALGSLTFDLTHIESAYDAWYLWRWASPNFKGISMITLASPWNDWQSSMEQKLATLRFFAVDRYFAQLETLVENDRREIQAWRRRHYRKILNISRIGITLEGVKTDLVALLENLEQDFPDLQFMKTDLPVAAQKSLESYELRMHELIMQYAQVVITHRKHIREGFDETQDDGLGDRIEMRSKQETAPWIVAIDIRRLNRSTIDQLARALPRDASDAFRKHALELVSPFAYTRPDYEHVAEYAIDSSLIETDVKDTIRGFINELNIRRLRLSEKAEKRYDAWYSAEEVFGDNQAFYEDQARLRDYDENDSRVKQDLNEAKQELEDYDLEGLAKVRQLLGLAFDVVQDARAAENRVSEDAEAARKRAVREQCSPRYDSPFITHLEVESFLDSIGVVKADRKQTILSYYEALAEKLWTARRAYDQDRAQIIPFSEVANLEDFDEQRRQRLEIVEQLMELEKQWINTRRVIEREFTERLAGGLTDDQTDDWYREVRRLRRLRIIPTVMTRSRKDLFDLVEFLDDLGIKSRTKADINSILESYEYEMDRLLSKYEEQHETAQQNFLQFNMIANQSNDPADKRRARKHLEILHNIRYRPENLNLQYVQIISDTLTGEDRTTFRGAARQHMYPWADVAPPVEIVSQMIERDQVLSQDQQADIRDILYHYKISRDSIIVDLIRLVRAWWDENDTDRKSQFQDRAERRLLDRILLEKNTLRFIRELFNPDQLELFALDIQLLLSPTP